MKQPVTPSTPPVKIPVGPNWKLIRNIFIIAGLLIAILITLEIRREAEAKRERMKREAVERQKEAREKAEAEAKARIEARRREAQEAALRIKREAMEAPEPSPPVEMNSHTGKNPGIRVKTREDVPDPELPPEIISLNTKAKDLVLSAGTKRDEQLAANVKKLTWDLDAYLRTLAKSEEYQGITNVNRIKNEIENNRLPNSIMRSGNIDFTRKMEDITGFALRKQKEIDQAFIAEAAKIQGAYIRKIDDAAKEAGAAGKKPLADYLKRIAEDATNLGEWLRSLGVDEPSE